MKRRISELFSQMRTVKQQAGFTMIELLIVIAILGILAVAVLSAINPVEQINRGRDTGSRSDSEQLLSALDRYNAFQGYYPWQNGASDTTYEITPLTPWELASDIPQATTTCAVSDLLSAGSTTPACTGANELKVTFFSRIFDAGYNHMSIYHGTNASDSTYICFAPRSDAFKTEAATRVAGTLPIDYPAAAVADTTGLCGPVGTASDCVCLP